jgi:hypothetical protein
MGVIVARQSVLAVRTRKRERMRVRRRIGVFSAGNAIVSGK